VAPVVQSQATGQPKEPIPARDGGRGRGSVPGPRGPRTAGAWLQGRTGLALAVSVKAAPHPCLSPPYSQR
jgi:hypothetical protein